jgi:hypothetical protein
MNAAPIIGRALPHNEQAERGLLGSILNDSDEAKPTFAEAVANGITSASFYSPANQSLWASLGRLHAEGLPLDAATLASVTKPDNEGMAHLMALTDAAPTTALFKKYLKDVLEAAVRRELIKLGSSAVERAFQQDTPEEIIAEHSQAVAQLIRPTTNRLMNWDALLGFTAAEDPDCLMGKRFLGRTGACLLVAPSGVGKSVLSIQLAALAALGRPFFGMQVHKPLRVLYAQAEDDFGDVAEAVQGFIRGFGLSKADQAAVASRVRIVRWNDCTGERFTARLRSEYALFPFDLVIANPLFSFAGCNVSEQKEISPFLRNLLNPVLTDLRAAAVIVHHTNKPPSDQKNERHDHDLQYLGSGSSELTNWSRACITLQRVKSAPGQVYKLTFAKRGTRTGIKDEDGRPLLSIYIEHSTEGLCWMPSDWSPDKSTGGKFVAKFNLDDARRIYDPALTWRENEAAIAAQQGMTGRAVRAYRHTLEAVLGK